MRCFFKCVETWILLSVMLFQSTGSIQPRRLETIRGFGGIRRDSPQTTMTTFTCSNIFWFLHKRFPVTPKPPGKSTRLLGGICRSQAEAPVAVISVLPEDIDTSPPESPKINTTPRVIKGERNAHSWAHLVATARWFFFNCISSNTMRNEKPPPPPLCPCLPSVGGIRRKRILRKNVKNERDTVSQKYASFTSVALKVGLCAIRVPALGWNDLFSFGQTTFPLHGYRYSKCRHVLEAM